jgi:hypothetical protein
MTLKYNIPNTIGFLFPYHLHLGVEATDSCHVYRNYKLHVHRT